MIVVVFSQIFRENDTIHVVVVFSQIFRENDTKHVGPKYMWYFCCVLQIFYRIRHRARWFIQTGSTREFLSHSPTFLHNT
jgi:hypothetical protein